MSTSQSEQSEAKESLFEGLAEEWWSDEWWELDGMTFDGTPMSRLRDSVRELRTVFDRDWVRGWPPALASNYIFESLYLRKGAVSAKFILLLGEVISRLKRCDGFNRKRQDLKSEKCDAALLELLVADVFARSEYDISFPREGRQKIHDVLAKGRNGMLAIECKSLQPEEWESWEEVLMHELWKKLPMPDGIGSPAVALRLNPRLSEVRLQKDYVLANRAAATKIATVIGTALENALKSCDVPFELVIDEFATAQVSFSTETQGSFVEGMERESPAVFRKISNNALIPASLQLPSDVPGLVFVEINALPSDFFFDEMIDSLFDAERARLGHIVAVILSPRNSIFSSREPRLYLNRHSKFGEEAELWHTELYRLFLPRA